MSDELETTHTEYRVTFGQKWAQISHPVFADAHPDGWVSIWVPNRLTDHYGLIARREAFARFGENWAFIYRIDPDDRNNERVFQARLYPRGELARYFVT